MRRSSSLHQAALWRCVLLCLAVRITRAQSHDLYRRVGDGVVLSPDLSSVREPTISSISWKHGDDLAIEWDRDGGIIEPYRQFRGQATLNITTAELKISGLTGNFSGKYEVEVNGKPITSSSRVLKVIFPVSKPKVSWRCDEGLTSCLLSCDGDITAQDQVIWRRDVQQETDLPKQLNITKERDADYKEFRCVLVNQVSEESSEPVVNPLSKAPGEKPVEGQKWMTGLTVFISLLAVLVVLALVHRSKAGFWFYDTEFMPWEGGFWRRSETAGEDHAANGRALSNAEAAESNGTNAAREQRHEEDELVAETAIQ